MQIEAATVEAALPLDSLLAMSPDNLLEQERAWSGEAIAVILFLQCAHQRVTKGRGRFKWHASCADGTGFRCSFALTLRFVDHAHGVIVQRQAVRSIAALARRAFGGTGGKQRFRR